MFNTDSISLAAVLIRRPKGYTPTDDQLLEWKRCRGMFSASMVCTDSKARKWIKMVRQEVAEIIKSAPLP